MVQQLRHKTKESVRMPKLNSYYDYAISVGGGKTTTTPAATSYDSINTIGYHSTSSLPVRRVKIPSLISANDTSAIVRREKSDSDTLEVRSQASPTENI